MSRPAAPASRRKFVEKRGVAQRQLVERLGHVQPREPDLRGAGQIEVVALDRVDVRALGREEARAVHRLLAHEHRRQHRREAFLDEPVEREAVVREREQCGVADPVAEARAGHARRALHLEAADLRVLLRLCELRRLAPALQLLRVVLRVAVRRRLVRRVGHARERLVPRVLGFAVLLLETLQLLLHAAELLELLGRRLALQLRLRAQLGHLRLELAPAGVGGHQLVERLACSLARDRRPEALGVAARGADVDHPRESRAASITCATPSSAAGGQTKSATASTRSCALATATA